MVYGRAFCNQCDENKKVERRPINHILHVILSILTIGLWIPVWVAFGIWGRAEWGCTECGSQDVSGERPEVKGFDEAERRKVKEWRKQKEIDRLKKE